MRPFIYIYHRGRQSVIEVDFAVLDLMSKPILVAMCLSFPICHTFLHCMSTAAAVVELFWNRPQVCCYCHLCLSTLSSEKHAPCAKNRQHCSCSECECSYRQYVCCWLVMICSRNTLIVQYLPGVLMNFLEAAKKYRCEERHNTM